MRATCARWVGVAIGVVAIALAASVGSYACAAQGLSGSASSMQEKVAAKEREGLESLKTAILRILVS